MLNSMWLPPSEQVSCCIDFTQLFLPQHRNSAVLAADRGGSEGAQLAHMLWKGTVD